MDLDPITWYAVTRDLKPDPRGPLDLAQALRVVDDYASRLRPQYDTGEEALAETMFGFRRDSWDFIEICFHTLRQISVSVSSPPWPLDDRSAMLDGVFTWEQTLKSLDVLKGHVTAYFSMEPDAFKRYLQPPEPEE